MPRPPDAGFFGRDETLLALDRAFDTQHGRAAARVRRGGQVLDGGGVRPLVPGHRRPGSPRAPGVGPGAVLWSSFEHHLTADRVIGAAGDYFAGLLEASGIQWAAVTDPAQRRDLVLQVLAQVPVLWVWDNVEPVTGFPEGTASDWTQAEQDELADLLRDLAQTHPVQGAAHLPPRRASLARGISPPGSSLPAMPMRESLQLAAALAARHGHNLATADWRPLLRYAVGNPLTITVLVGAGAAGEPGQHGGYRGVRGPAAGRGSAARSGGGRGAGPHPVAGRLAQLRVRAGVHRRRAGPAGGAAPVPRHRRRRRPPLHGRPRDRRGGRGA